MGYFWPKYIMSELKKYRGVIFHDTRKWCKIWRKSDLLFGKWHEEFGKFSPEHTEVSNLGLLLGPFIQNRKCMSLKFTGKLCVMTLKNDANFEEELTYQFKIDIKNLTNFGPSTKICILMGCFWPNYIMFELKKYRGVMFHGIEDLRKIWRKIDLGFQKWQEQFSRFSPEHVQKSKKWDFYWVLLSKVENVWA